MKTKRFIPKRLSSRSSKKSSEPNRDSPFSDTGNRTLIDNVDSLQHGAGIHTGPFINKDVIDTIYELTLAQYITCLVDGDLRVLVRRWDNVTEGDVLDAWMKIKEEYSEALISKRDLSLLHLSKQATMIEARIQFIHNCIMALAIEYDENTVKQLNAEFAVWEELDPSDPEKYKAALIAIYTRSTRLEVELRETNRDLESVSSTEMPTKTDRREIEKLIIQVSKHMQRPIDRFTTLLSEFVYMIADMIMVNDVKREALKR